jgi:DNA-directed RNA polymerase specialized sigma24 family protein
MAKQPMVAAAVQRALAKERAALPPLDTSTPAPAPEVPLPPVTDLSYNDNTVIQEGTPWRSIRRGGLKLTPQQEAALRAKRQQGTPIKALMEEYGISKATVHRYLQ